MAQSSQTQIPCGPAYAISDPIEALVARVEGVYFENLEVVIRALADTKQTRETVFQYAMELQNRNHEDSQKAIADLVKLDRLIDILDGRRIEITIVTAINNGGINRGS